ncbi:sigma-70 family RNA polymerase sigma factor [Streptomyces sp. LP05-1]|uniref:Sigma-70 family RNA polymerase sigma factor n=1 Tax=Streptomyces pyxinae TaxID=2970734 RepID=A0ABT2CE48_9ACTN|nr:sigma-70 family RNA polymerase sigma factor [Streptomyces sp. LP05-1]MCS0635688.1 sigma-70 family RNA polymerase sigma factor [Streptomyces sp. LP05-1]
MRNRPAPAPTPAGTAEPTEPTEPTGAAGTMRNAGARAPGSDRAGRAGSEGEPDGTMTAAEFDAAFTAVMPRLRRRLLAMTGDPYDADDLVQETYLRLARRARASTLAHQRHAYAYTCAAALNLLRDQWARPARREQCTDRLPERGWDGGFAAREAEVTVLGLLRKLSPKEASAVFLVDIEGLTHDGAGERLGAHRGTVQRNRMRGLAKLRAVLAGDARTAAPAGDARTAVRAMEGRPGGRRLA